MSTPPVRLGMIGGGAGAFIGSVHRMAAALDGRCTLVAGALASDPARARESAKAWNLPRGYGSWREMLDAESALPMSDRIEAVSIVTPNATHAQIARACIERGLHVILDKPMVTGLADARELVRLVGERGRVFVVTYNYSGYPMVRHARQLVREGTIGAVRKVFVEYHQGWLATDLAATGQKQASWRADPALAGPGGAIGDIGTHAEHLARFVTGLEIESLACDLTRFVQGRALDDDASVLLRFANGARGVLTASQVCIGEKNNLTLRVHGDKGSLWWNQQTPETLTLATLDGATRGISRGDAGVAQARLPGGHPEGFIEAFATLYAEAARMIRDPSGPTLAPTVRDGALGVAFVEACVASGTANARWVPLPSVTTA
jgi:predicted dehydrogenase